MPRDGQRAADRLNRYLDAVVAGCATTSHDLDPALAEAIVHFLSLGAGDVPDPGFVERLERQLVDGGAPLRPVRLIAGASRSIPLSNGRAASVPRPVAPQRRWAGAEFAAAAIVLVALAAVFIDFRLAPTDPTTETGVPPAVDAGTSMAIPSPLSKAVDIAECTAQPRPAGTTARLAGTRPRTPAILRPLNSTLFAPGGREPLDADAVLAGLPEAGSDVATGIAVTARQLTACRLFAYLYDDQSPHGVSGVEQDGRYFALYSDDFFRRELDGFHEEGQEPELYTAWVPSGSSSLSVEQPRLLPDGRVAAVLHKGPSWPFRRWLVIFVRSDDRWLVDEVGYDDRAELRVFGTPPGPTPVHLEPPQDLDIVLRDGHANWGAPSRDASFRAGRDVVVTIANLGGRTHRVVIAKLGVDAEVPAGHSVTVVLNAPQGTYKTETSVWTSVEDLRPIGNIVFRGLGTPIPRG